MACSSFVMSSRDKGMNSYRVNSIVGDLGIFPTSNEDKKKIICGAGAAW